MFKSFLAKSKQLFQNLLYLLKLKSPFFKKIQLILLLYFYTYIVCDLFFIKLIMLFNIHNNNKPNFY